MLLVRDPREVAISTQKILKSGRKGGILHGRVGVMTTLPTIQSWIAVRFELMSMEARFRKAKMRLEANPYETQPGNTTITVSTERNPNRIPRVPNSNDSGEMPTTQPPCVQLRLA
jgi:hypothetical protein